jgi:mannan endo-1,4-beta-mannosidase
LWNEVHPAYAENRVESLIGAIDRMTHVVRTHEQRWCGRRQLLTVSVFGPLLIEGFYSRDYGTISPDARLSAMVFAHPELDFASVHTYATGTIDAPRNTVDPALDMARLTREAIAHAPPSRPVLDTEHGPIHTFKDRRRTLPAAFDEECFRHTAWAHLAAGGAGIGMRWPNSHPHVLTDGMHDAQLAVSRFVPLIRWGQLQRRDLGDRLTTTDPRVHAIGCGDDRQAIVWLVRAGPYAADRRLSLGLSRPARLCLSSFTDTLVTIAYWDTRSGVEIGRDQRRATASGVEVLTPPFQGDLALAMWTHT